MDAASNVLIVGGGLVGTSLALALDQAGIAVTLVEARPPGAALADPDRERYLALAHTSLNALAALGVALDLEACAAPIEAVHVSRRGDFGRVLLRARDHGFDRFGAVVPASRLGLALEAALGNGRHLRRLAPARLLELSQQAGRVDAVIETGEGRRTLAAKALVGADGVDSPVRELAGLPVEREAYGQDALVLSVGLGRDHDAVARERFTSDGAIALLPLPGRRAGLVWTLPSERARAVAEASGSRVLSLLQDVLGQAVGALHSPGRMIRYPLLRSRAPECVRGRVVLVGNAAQSLHPIAAQGFNLGLRDALVLAEELAGMAAADSDSDAVFAALRGYAKRRQPDRDRIAALSHSLARWPKLDAPGLSLVRSLAMAVVNAVPALRASLVLAAMGYADDAPAKALEPAA